jgi:leucyl/phenylalanyl-tRNA--protein transferase
LPREDFLKNFSQYAAATGLHLTSIGRAVSDDRLFHESLIARLQRWILALAFMVQPKRLHQLPRLTRLSLEWKFQPARARQRLLTDTPENELVAVVDDLSVETVIAALRRGVYPRAHLDPIKWWSPDVRGVMDPNNAHIEKNLRRLFRQGKWTVSFDRDFAGVLRGCADTDIRRVPLTWLTPRFARLYIDLHKAGHAHSTEVWDENGKLIGGLFGVAVGGVFYGHSQFTAQRDASKFAVAALHRHLAHWGFKVRDAQRMTPHLQRLGFAPMPRAEFNALIAQHVDRNLNVPWTFDPGLDIANWKKDAG